jgi:hypothetical protein
MIKTQVVKCGDNGTGNGSIVFVAPRRPSVTYPICSCDGANIESLLQRCREDYEIRYGSESRSAEYPEGTTRTRS